VQQAFTLVNDPMSASSGPRSALFLVFIIVFIDLLGFGIVLPLLPLFADQYLQGYSETGKGLMIGALFSSFSLMQFLFSPIWGRLSDRIGRRPILLLSLIGSVVFYALFAFASTLPASQSVLALMLLLVARMGAGIAGASVSTASAVIADCTLPEKRSKGMALIGAAFGIGFTFGPLIGFAGLEFFRDEPWAPGATASALALVALIVAFFKLPETLPVRNDRPARHGFSLGRSLEVLKIPSVGPLILMYFLAILAFANFEATLAMYTKEVFSFSTKQILLVFAGVGFVLMVAQGGFYRRFAGKKSERTLLIAGLVMMFLGLGGLGFVAYGVYAVQQSSAGSESLFYLATAIAVFGFAFVNPSVAALVSRRADPLRQGEILGVNQSFAAIGRIIGPAVGSFVFWQHPSRTLPFITAGVVLFMVVLLLPMIKQTEPMQASAEPAESLA
jgi:MFS family permease